MRLVTAVCLLLIGCQGREKAAPAPEPTAESCRAFLVKARFVLQEMGSAAGMTYTQSIEEKAIKDCEADLAAGKASDLMKCVLATNTTDGVRACFPTYEQVKQGGTTK